jgi:hypothetical protein
MVRTPEIRAQLCDLLAGKHSLDEFEDWFVPATWDIHKSKDVEAEALTDEIELRLSEHSDGYLTSDDLMRELGALAAIKQPLVK